MNSSEKVIASVLGSSADIAGPEEGLNEKEKARLFELFAELAKAAFGDHFQTRAEFPQFIVAYRQWVKVNHQEWVNADKQGQLNASVQDAVPFVWPDNIEKMSLQAAEKKLNLHRSWWVKQLKAETDQSAMVSGSESLLEHEFSPQPTFIPSTETEKGDPAAAIEKFVMEKVEKLEYWDGEVFIREYVYLLWSHIFPNEKFVLEQPDTRLDLFSKDERSHQLEIWKKLIEADPDKAVQAFNSLRERAGRIVIKKEVELVGQTVAEERDERTLEWWIWYHINRDDAEINKMLEPFEERRPVLNVTQERQIEKNEGISVGEHVTIYLQKNTSQELDLSDGIKVADGDAIAAIHIMRELEKLKPLSNVEAARKLLVDLENALFQFAQLLIEQSEMYEVKAIILTTHFFSIKFTEWGFDEFEVADKFERVAIAEVGKTFTMARNPNADEDNVFEQKYRQVRKYAISRQKFLEKFGKKVEASAEAAA